MLYSTWNACPIIVAMRLECISYFLKFYPIFSQLLNSYSIFHDFKFYYTYCHYEIVRKNWSCHEISLIPFFSIYRINNLPLTNCNISEICDVTINRKSANCTQQRSEGASNGFVAPCFSRIEKCCDSNLQTMIKIPVVATVLIVQHLWHK